MAHEITSTDGMVLAGKPAWHGLGLVVEQAPTVRDALKLARLDWRIEALPVFAREQGGANDGAQVPCSAFRANVRSDTREVLAVVGEGYRALQNADLADLIDSLGLERDGVKVESAGSLRGGRIVFFLARTASFALAGDDEVTLYTLFANTHDGSSAFRAFGTSVRVVCKNTLNQALGKHVLGLTIRHTESLPERVQEGRRALGILGKRSAEFQAEAESLAARPMLPDDVKAFFLEVYEKANGRVPTNPRTEQEERSKRRAVATVAEWTRNLDDFRQSRLRTRGTAWSALQAVTQWADHERTVRTSDAEQSTTAARVHSNLFGSAAEFKAQAFEAALALV